MNLVQLINNRKADFVDLCVAHKVDAFGSSITDRFDAEKSDIDVLVELNLKDPLEYGETLLSLWDNLESFFERRVDLLTEESIHNPYLRKSIEATKTLIYDGQREKIFV
jgi:uncharacterized protein